MRRKDTMTLGEALKCWINEQHFDIKIDETKVLASVEDVFGKHLSSYITSKRIYQKKLFLKVNSSVVRNEMMMMRQGILKTLNEKIGRETITDIIIQ